LPKVLRAAELAAGEPELRDEAMAAFGQRAGLASIFGI
jgi:hypothetical protein